jgi:hypothetical protein
MDENILPVVSKAHRKVAREAVLRFYRAAREGKLPPLNSEQRHDQMCDLDIVLQYVLLTTKEEGEE